MQDLASAIIQEFFEIYEHNTYMNLDTARCFQPSGKQIRSSALMAAIVEDVVGTVQLDMAKIDRGAMTRGRGTWNLTSS